MKSRVKISSSKDEILALTGIRGFASFWVVGCHYALALSLLFPALRKLVITCLFPGRLGVDLFFMLSGFIIAYNYQEKLCPFRISAYKEFLWARLARIYPLHLATLSACLALYAGARIVGEHLHTGETNWGAFDFFTNVFMIHAWNLNYHPSWNFPSWSISCEWLAYLSFPALAAIVALKWSRVSLWTFVALLLGGQLALNLIHDNDSSDWRLLSILFEFPTGVCLYRLYRLRNENDKPSRFSPQPGAALVLGATWAACGATKAAHCVLIPLIALVLYSIAVDARGFLSKILASRIACYWGRVSYSLYMTHAVTSMVLVRFMRLDNYIGRHLTVRLAMCVIYFGSLAAVAALVYHAIEEPARRQMRRIYPK